MAALFKDRIIYASLILLVLFHLTVNYIWLKQDTTYLINDSHHHLLLSFAVFDELQAQGLPTLEKVFDRVTMHHRWHGVLVAYATAPFFFLLGKTQDAAVMAMAVIFLPLLLFSVYGIGRNIRDEKTGLLAAFIISLYPIIFNHLRVYLLDLPLTAMVSLSVYFLLKSEQLTNKKHTVLFSIVVVLGLLCKINFLIFIVGPLAASAYQMFSSATSAERRRWLLKVLILLSIVCIVLLPFLRIKRWEIAARLTEYCWLNPVYYRSPASLAIFIRDWFVSGIQYSLWFATEFINTIVSFVFFTALCMAALPFSKYAVRKKPVLILWIVVPLAIMGLLFVNITVNRYIMPLLPAVAVITATGLLMIKKQLVRRTTVAFIIVCGVLQYSLVSFNPLVRFHPHLSSRGTLNLEVARLANGNLYEIHIYNGNGALGYRNSQDDAAFPQRPAFDPEILLQKIIGSMDDRINTMNVCFIDALPKIYEPVEYLARKNNYPISVTINSPNAELSQRDRGDPSHSIACADYVVTTEKASPYGPTKEIAARVIEAKNAFKGRLLNFSLIASFPLAGGDRLNVYKYKNPYAMLAQGPLRLYFRDGLVKLYFNDQLLTRTFGMGNRFISDGKKLVSNMGQWHIERVGKKSISAYVLWPDTDIGQRWIFELNTDSAMTVSIETASPDPASITDVQFFVSLVPRYHYWREGDLKARYLVSRGVRQAVHVPLALPLQPLTFFDGSLPALTLIVPKTSKNALLSDQKDGPLFIFSPHCQDNHLCSYAVEFSFKGNLSKSK